MMGEAITEKLWLEEVGPGNWRVKLKVKEEQKEYVAAWDRILARAYAYRDSRSRAYVLYLGEEPVGGALYYDLEEMGAYDFSQFFIDKRYQGRGLGKAACRLVLDKMRQDGRYRKVFLCYIEGNRTAEKLYTDLGFLPTGEVDEDEVVMSMEL